MCTLFTATRVIYTDEANQEIGTTTRVMAHCIYFFIMHTLSGRFPRLARTRINLGLAHLLRGWYEGIVHHLFWKLRFLARYLYRLTPFPRERCTHTHLSPNPELHQIHNNVLSSTNKAQTNRFSLPSPGQCRKPLCWQQKWAYELPTR